VFFSGFPFAANGKPEKNLHDDEKGEGPEPLPKAVSR
jgi:hypothetical protein